MSKLVIKGLLEVSTYHITRSTASWLDSAAAGDLANYWNAPCVYGYEYGYFVDIPEEGVYDEKIWPADFQVLVYIARMNGCGCMMLDCDGPIIEGLETYDW